MCCSLQIWHVSYGRCVQGRAVVHHRRQVGSQLPGSVGQHFAAQHLHTRHEDTESVGWSRVQWRGERTPPQHRAASNLANFTESDAPLQSPSRACSTRECHKNRQSSESGNRESHDAAATCARGLSRVRWRWFPNGNYCVFSSPHLCGGQHKSCMKERSVTEGSAASWRCLIVLSAAAF